MSRPCTDFVAAVVPAHDEAARLGACLEALSRAAAFSRAAGVASAIVVVLDGCHDDSDAVCAAAPDVHVVRGEWLNVGAARRAGCTAALRRAAAGGVPPASTWLASSDADSTVPFDWLTHHVWLADRGADAVRGMVSVDDWSGWTAPLRSAFTAAYRAAAGTAARTADGHPHVHGANLGVRGSAYLAAGGFPPVRCHEDVRLVDALVAQEAHVVSTARAPVRTSARAVGRTPDGFARHLRDLNRDLARDLA